jgi:hypothetical protein
MKEVSIFIGPFPGFLPEISLTHIGILAAPHNKLLHCS